MIDSWRIVITGACFTLCNICGISAALKHSNLDIFICCLILILGVTACLSLYVLLIKTVIYAEKYQRAYEAFKEQVKLTTENKF